jgi:hypothetical protein
VTQVMFVIVNLNSAFIPANLQDYDVAGFCRGHWLSGVEERVISDMC